MPMVTTYALDCLAQVLSSGNVNSDSTARAILIEQYGRKALFS
jgi:hypothetical protein